MEEKFFLKELLKLFEKYSISIDENDDYDGDENYIGTNYVLRGLGDIYMPIDILKDKIKKASKDIDEKDL